MNKYDPNITWAKQKVRVSFQQWDYKVSLETVVGGNCQGFAILDSAVDNILDDLPSNAYGDAFISMEREDGEILEVEVYTYDDLKELVVGAEIIEQVEYKP